MTQNTSTLVLDQDKLDRMPRSKRRELSRWCRENQVTPMICMSISVTPKWFAPFTIPTH